MPKNSKLKKVRVAKKAVKKGAKAAPKATKPASSSKKPVSKKPVAKKTAKPVVKPVKKTVKTTKVTKPVKKTATKKVNPKLADLKSKTGKIGKPVRIARRGNNAVPVVDRKPKHPVNNDAPKSKIQAVKVKLYSEQEVLEKLKEVFPELSRKRVIENVVLSAKQLKKLEKKPKLCARIPASVKRKLGIIDESTKRLEEEEKQAKTRVVDEKKAEENKDILQNFDALTAAKRESQSSKVIKAMQVRLSHRLFGIYGNYKKIQTQLNNFTSVALEKLSNDYSFSSQVSSDLKAAVTSVSSIFKIEDTTDNDVFDSLGTKLPENVTSSGFDSEGTYVDHDKGEPQVGLIIPSEQLNKATAADGDSDADNSTSDSIDSENADYDDNSEDFQETEPSTTPGTKAEKKSKVKVNAIKIVGQTRIRYSDRAYMASRCGETRSLFNGMKRSAFVGFTMGAIDLEGNFSTSSVVYDSHGNAHNKAKPNKPMHGDSALPFHSDSALFDKFVSNLSGLMGMRTTTDIGLLHVCSRQALNFLKLGGFNANYRVLVRNNADNTGRYGVIISVARAETGTGSKVLTIPFGMLGIAHKEITTICQGDFQEMNDKLFEYVTYSIISNGLMAQGKVFGFSAKERSLLAPPKEQGAPSREKIIKMANGHIHVIPDVDKREEFALYKESLKLPEILDDTYIDDDGKTELDKYAGTIVYTDTKANIVFSYNKYGRLTTSIFGGACELNDRDRADLMKETPTKLGVTMKSYDPTNKDHRLSMSPYGCATLMPIRYLGPANMALLKPSAGPSIIAGFTGFTYRGGGDYVYLRVEDLRVSYQSDKVYYNVIQESIENYLNCSDSKLDQDSGKSGNGADLLSGKGLTDCDWETASLGEKNAYGKLSPRDATAIKIMLHIAAKSTDEWPTVDVLNARAEGSRVTPPAPTDLDDVTGSFDGLRPDENGDYPTAMPHQAYIEHTLAHQETAALDCDMGGGKTFMSCLDATQWIKKGVHGQPARPCIVMPAGLIENYITDVKNNFFGKNLNFFVISTSTKGWSKMDNSKIADLAMRSPINTFFVTSYEWLGLESYPVIVGTELKEKTIKKAGSKNTKTFIEVPKSEQVYPNVQFLLDLGVNVLYLDESQKIKNSSSSTHKAMQGLSGIPIKRIMTGTMVTRDVDDVFTQTSFIDGTMMGTRKRFRALYCDDNKATEIKKGLEKKVRTHLMASGVMQVRRSMWMGLLPKKKEHFEFVDLEDLHGQVYDVLMQDLIDDQSELDNLATYYIKDDAMKKRAQNRLKVLCYGSDVDTGDSAELRSLERQRAADVGDVVEEEESTAGRSKDNKVQQFFETEKNMGVKFSMLQAFISNPQALTPETFSKKAQEELKALNAELPKHTQKDIRIAEIIKKHFAPIGGSYIKRSEQNKTADGDLSKVRGKIIIFALNNSTVEHVYAYLRTTAFKDQTRIFIKSGQYASQGVKNLLDFKDPENTEASIIVAAETSVIYGHNMQSADLMIKLTVPWTTGDYDQAVARIFRNGQKLNCEVYNIIANGTFEIGKMTKFLIRENSNRKLISEYSNPYNMNHALGEMGKEGVASKLMTESDMRGFKYRDQETGNTVIIDLIALHDSIYEHEVEEGKRYLEVFKDAGYGDPNTTRIEIASGIQTIDAISPELRPVDPDGKTCVPGPLNLSEMAYFDGANVADADLDRRSKSAEIKRNLGAEFAQSLGDEYVNALNLKGATGLLNQYMIRALDAVLKAHPKFKKFVPSSTRGFNLFMGQAVREADYRLIAAQGLSYNNFAEQAGNDLSDPTVRMELMTLARLVYNKIVANYTGCVAIDDDIGLKYDKSGKAVDVIGYDKKIDSAMMKKNAAIISKIVGKADIKEEEQTQTQKMIEENKRKALVEQEEEPTETEEDGDDLGEIDSEDDIEGITLGVSEMVYVDEGFEGHSTKNIPTNDAVYVFAPAGDNQPKFLKKLAKVNVGQGRGTKMFTRKIMWVYNRPVTDMKQVISIATAIENAGGYVEKVGKGPAQKYGFSTDEAFLTLFKLKAPTNFAKIDNYAGGLHDHVATAVAASKPGRKSEVEIGLYMVDRRILVVGESKDETLLQKIGFKRIEMLRIDFDRSPKIQAQLEVVFSRIRKAGLNILNADIVAKRLKVITGKKVIV